MVKYAIMGFLLAGLYLGFFYFTTTPSGTFGNEPLEIPAIEEIDGEVFKRNLLGLPNIEFSHYKITPYDLAEYQSNKILSMSRQDPTKETAWTLERKRTLEAEKKASEQPPLLPPSEDAKPDPVIVEPKEESKVDKNTITGLVGQFSSKYNIPKEWVLAVIEVESGFNPMATNQNANGTIDRGLMQINSLTAPEIARKLGMTYKEGMEFDAQTNIEMGTFYLRFVLDTKASDVNDEHYIFTAYNYGPTGATDYFEKNSTYETPYSKAVLRLVEEAKRND